MILSIIIPSFQQGALLRGALESIEQQSFKDYEILILDAESKDDTVEIVAEFKNLPIRFYSERDKGIYDAMNKGIDLSLGDFLYFMGCDDRLASPDVLFTVFNRNLVDLHVIYGDVIFTNFISENVRYDGEFTYLKLIKANICHQAIFTHKKVFKSLGKFDIRYKILADWEFNMRWFNTLWVKRIYIPVIIANYNTLGFSSNLKDDAFFAEEMNIKKANFPKIVTYLASNINRPLHYRLLHLLTFKRVSWIKNNIKFI